MYTHVAIDTETSGLGKNGHSIEVVELYAVEFDPVTGETGQEFYRLCKAVQGIEPGATAVHHITDEQVKDCEPYEPLKSSSYFDLIKFIDGRTLVGHNIIKYDLPVLGIKTDDVYDTLVVCRRLFDGRHKNIDCAEYFGIEFNDDQAHGAKYDTLTSIKVFMKLQDTAVIAELEYRDRVMNEALKIAPALVKEIANGEQVICITAENPKEPVKMTDGRKMVKRSSYLVRTSGFIPKWAQSTPIHGVVMHPVKGWYVSCELVNDSDFKPWSKYIDLDSGEVYDKFQVQNILPESAKKPRTNDAFAVGVHNIVNYGIIS